MNFYGYGCIYGIEPKDGIENSKVSQELNSLTKEIRGYFIPEDCIHIDVISNSKQRRRELERIIDNIKNDKSSIDESPRGVIFIPSIFDLGTSAEEIKKNFDNIVLSNIGLLVGDSESLSTVNYGFSYFPDWQNRIDSIENKINNLTFISTRKGRNKAIQRITGDFRTVYWLFEQYIISEKKALDNTLTGKMSKTKFYNLCKAYEQSERYADDEEANRRNMPELLEKPKRYGVVPNDFESSDHSNMTETTYRRMLLKKKGGRKAMAQASVNYNDEDSEHIKELLG